MTTHGLRTGPHRLAPQTAAGRYSVGLFLLFLVAMAMFLITTSLEAGTTEPEFWADLEATVPLMIGAAAAIASVVSGAVARLRSGERSLVVLVTTTIAGLVTAFFVGEFLSVIGVLPEH